MDCHRGLPDAGRAGPSFAYAVDRSGKGLQELAIYGLPGQVAHSLLNQLARRIVESGVALQTGDRIEGRPGRRCASGGGGDDRRQGSKSDARVLRRRRRRSAGGVAGLRWGAAVGRGRSEQRCRTASAGAPSGGTAGVSRQPAGGDDQSLERFFRSTSKDDAGAACVQAPGNRTTEATGRGALRLGAQLAPDLGINDQTFPRLERRSRHSRGDIPYSARKARLQLEILENPCRLATASIVVLVEVLASSCRHDWRRWIRIQSARLIPLSASTL